MLKYPLAFILLFSFLNFSFLNSFKNDEKIPSEYTRDTLPLGIQKILKAYPEHFKGATANSLIWKDGTEMPFDDGIKNKSFDTLLDAPDLEDQVMAMPYSIGSLDTPQYNHDPGRIRYEPFFLKMYGNSAEEVKKHLVEVTWLPKTINQKLLVSTINGVDKKFKAISDELDNKPHLKKYLQNAAGTFNWRKISGTNRLSTHSFGVTIDINTQYSHYWQWDYKDWRTPSVQKALKWRNLIPLEIVKVFEKHGFVWGGKWYHYDTMHFEYRPELL